MNEGLRDLNLWLKSWSYLKQKASRIIKTLLFSYVHNLFVLKPTICEIVGSWSHNVSSLGWCQPVMHFIRDIPISALRALWLGRLLVKSRQQNIIFIFHLRYFCFSLLSHLEPIHIIRISLFKDWLFVVLAWKKQSCSSREEHLVPSWMQGCCFAWEAAMVHCMNTSPKSNHQVLVLFMWFILHSNMVSLQRNCSYAQADVIGWCSDVCHYRRPSRMPSESPDAY